MDIPSSQQSKTWSALQPDLRRKLLQYMEDPETEIICQHNSFKYIIDPGPYNRLRWIGGRIGSKTIGVATSYYQMASTIDKRFNMSAHRLKEEDIRPTIHKEFVETLERRRLEHEYTVATDVITQKDTGTAIHFRGIVNQGRSAKGTPNNLRAFLDESTELDMETIERFEATVFRTQGAVVIHAFNPEFETDAIWQLCQVDDPRAKNFYMNYDENIHLRPDALHEILNFKKKHPGRFNHLYLGHIDRANEMLVFKEDSEDARKRGIDVHWKIAEKPPEVPPNAKLIGGCDWGFSTAPCAIVAAYVWPGYIYVFAERVAKFILNEDLAAFILGDACNGKNPNNHPGIPELKNVQIVGDNARPEAIHRLKYTDGVNIVPCKKPAGCIVERIQYLHDFMILVSPECTHMIRDLRNYRWQPHKSIEGAPDTKKPPVDEWNNCTDALGYGTDVIRLAAASHVPLVPLGETF